MTEFRSSIDYTETERACTCPYCGGRKHAEDLSCRWENCEKHAETNRIANLDALRRRHPFGFIAKSDLPELVRVSRLEPVLVRCGGCRFTAPAQDVAHLIAIITRDGTDYVRDVSFPAKRAT